MKHVLIGTLTSFCLLFSLNVSAQNLKKANKEFELYAFNLAIKSYTEVLQSEPNNVIALSRIAECYRHLDQIDEAVKWYAKAVQQNGVDPTTLLNYGKALMNQGKYEEAKKWFTLYAEGNPYYGNHYAQNCDFAESLRGVAAQYRVKKEYLNKGASDFGPAFYQNKVVYSSARTDLKRQDGKTQSNWMGSAKNQLFITTRDNNGYLQQPTFLRGDYRHDYNHGPVSYSKDGKWVAYTKNNFVNGTRQIPSSGISMSIYVAEVSGDGDWRDAKPFAHNGSGYSNGFPYLNEDGTELYFASDRPDGYGGYDLYVCTKTGDSWSVPMNLGPVVNSPGNEMTPYMENGTLYFASDWHAGLGGLDNFRATKNAGEWDRIFHLGNAVNSSHDDYGLIYDSQMNLGYFVSNRPGGKGNEDIYQFSQLSDNVVITVRNATDNSPIANAVIDFSACGEPTFTTNTRGEYSFQALPGLDCEGVVTKAGYNNYRFTLTSDGRKKSQRIEVLLTREADKYLGQVIDAGDNNSLGEVFVRATNQTNGQIMETVTDENGKYRLALAPNTTYVIRYSKVGYTDIHQRIRTMDGRDKSILGVVSLGNSTISIDNGGLISSNLPPEEEPKGSETTDDPATPEVVEDVVQSGFSVQIAAMGLNQNVDPKMYAKLQSIGNIYSRPEKGFKKLRIGIFESKDEADAARRKIAQQGYKKAFVVTEQLDDTEGVEIYNVLDKTPTSPAIESTPVVTEEERQAPRSTPVSAQPVSNSEVDEYLVRLAAYKNPQFFNASAVSDLGVIEQRRSGSFTVMFLAGFKSADQANSAKQKAVASGFKGAYVVQSVDGKLEKIDL